MPELRGLASRWKLLMIPIAVVVVGLAVALPIGLASVGSTAGASPARPDRAERPHVTAAPGVGCAVSYSATTWPGSFTAKVTITNRGSASINGWTLTFRFPGDEAVSSAWNATFTQTGAEVSAGSTTYDATIAPGASQSLGFLGAWTSNDALPAGFRVNRTACT